MTDERGEPNRESMRDSVRRLLEQRSPFAGMTRADLEQIVTEFLHGDRRSRERVEDLLEEVRAHSRRSVDRLGQLVRTEVRKEFGSFSPARREEIGEFFERLVGLVGEYFGPGRRERASVPETAPAIAEQPAKVAKKKVAAAKKTATKKATATKAAVKTATVKKAAAKSPAAKKQSSAPPEDA
jgi:hypothetical protein